MKKEQAKELYKRKIKEFKLHNSLYFEKNDPKLTDSDFDKLKSEILELEKKYKFFDHVNSPSRTIGSEPSKNFKKVAHRAPMLSLANAFSKEDLLNFQTIKIII